jgi:hypothetical protein
VSVISVLLLSVDLLTRRTGDHGYRQRRAHGYESPISVRLDQPGSEQDFARRIAMTNPTRITRIGTVIVPVSDQERAVAFYVETLGFEKRLDLPFGDGGRWIEVAPRSGPPHR